MFVKSALITLTLAALANAAAADPTAWREMRTGDMRKLAIHDAPLAGSDVSFLSETGEEMTLAQFEGQHVVLNFWATWCAPCRVEMPHLSALQEEMGSEDFSVVTIATGRNPREGMEAFFAEIGVDNLPLHTDPRQELARSLGVLGLPVTLILDPEGREIARLQGEADWSAEAATTLLAEIMAAR